METNVVLIGRRKRNRTLREERKKKHRMLWKYVIEEKKAVKGSFGEGCDIFETRKVGFSRCLIS